MITVGKLRERLSAYPSETPVFLVTMRRDLRADIAAYAQGVGGGILVRSSIQPWVVYDSNHGRVTLWEHVALESINAAAEVNIKPPDKQSMLDKLVEAIGRHEPLANDPEVIDALADIKDALKQALEVI